MLISFTKERGGKTKKAYYSNRALCKCPYWSVPLLMLVGDGPEVLFAFNLPGSLSRPKSMFFALI
jgi:hypothetical protein